ncbi:hypothetical protein [Senegalia massiliensis]|uniref:hypothetical protein n=1 Tax=Senegalia massiliensis TaxID=1720316 RepID=UPI001032299E|nr:hypothetical protein [Senegalia massiliensis]
MFRDLIDLFGRAYDKYGDKIILDSYKPKNGLYIRINLDNSVDNLIINKESIESDLYNWFKIRDYYSKLIDMNKPIDGKKKIHSNNYLSFFIKKDNFIGKKSLTKEEISERIEDYFKVLRNPESKAKNNKDKMIYEKFETEVDQGELNRSYTYISENLDKIKDTVLEYDEQFDNYIKIFFKSEYGIDRYKVESERYMIPRIFNNNKYNIEINDEIYGLSNSNMGLNAKKPFLELKNMGIRVPYRITSKNAIYINKFFEWLQYYPYSEIFIPQNYDFKVVPTNYEEIPCHYLYITKGQDVTIEKYDFIPHYTSKINFSPRNILALEINGGIVEYKDITERFALEKEIDKKLFKKKLIKNYLKDPKENINGISKQMKLDLNFSKEAFHNYLKKGINVGIESILKKIHINIVKDYLVTESKWKAAEAFNLSVSLIEFFEGEEVMEQILDGLYLEIEQKLEKARIDSLTNDEEFYFLGGQLASYMLSQSEKDKPHHDMIEPFMRINNNEQLKRELQYVFNTYKHALRRDFKVFNRALSMVLSYNPSNKSLDSKLFLAGYLADNIFYRKRDKDEGDVKHEEKQ